VHGKEISPLPRLRSGSVEMTKLLSILSFGHYTIKPMTSKFKYLLVTTFSVLLPIAAHAQLGLDETAKKAGLFPSTPVSGPGALAGTIIGYGLAFVGVIFFVLMLYAGFLWMTARGNEEQVTKAQDLIKSAIIGMIIIFLSYVITNFVLVRLTSVAG